MLDKLIPQRWKKSRQTGIPVRNKQYRDPFGTEVFFPSLPFFADDSVLPRVDVREGRKHITVKAELPGVDKNDIDISIDNGLLRLSGEKKRENEETGDNYYRLESRYGRFRRLIELPAEVDPDDVDATFKKGVLRVKIKKTKGAQSRKISIRPG